MWLGIPKRFSFYSFHPMSARIYKSIGDYGGMQATIFRVNEPCFKNIVTLWNFNMGIKGEIVKCTMSWKPLAVERNGCKFESRIPMKCIFRTLFVWPPQFNSGLFGAPTFWCCSQKATVRSISSNSNQVYGKYAKQGKTSYYIYFCFIYLCFFFFDITYSHLWPHWHPLRIVNMMKERDTQWKWRYIRHKVVMNIDMK